MAFWGTGHGSDEHNCAEFCPTSHHFIINGKEHYVNYTEAGTNWGCADKVSPSSYPPWCPLLLGGERGFLLGEEVGGFMPLLLENLKGRAGSGNLCLVCNLSVHLKEAANILHWATWKHIKIDALSDDTSSRGPMCPIVTHLNLKLGGELKPVSRR